MTANNKQCTLISNAVNFRAKDTKFLPQKYSLELISFTYLDIFSHISVWCYLYSNQIVGLSSNMFPRTSSRELNGFRFMCDCYMFILRSSVIKAYVLHQL